MSLLDALLLDPLRMNVWVAVRTEAVPVAGTGTQNDPFDGSSAAKFDALMNALPVPVSGINYSGTTATVTAISHGFSNGNSVLIAGVTNSSLYNGTFSISNATDNTFQYTMTGTPTAPAQGANTDCILEQPGLNNALETTCLTSSGAEIGEFMVYARGSVIRNCFVNCEYRDRPVPVQSIIWSLSDSAFVITTTLPHGHASGDWVVIGGAMVNGSPYNSFNGSYQVTRLSDYKLRYINGPTQTSLVPSGNISVGRYPSQLVQITTISVAQNPGPPVTWTVTVTTATPHFLVPGQMVTMNGVVSDDIHNTVNLNGPFQVLPGSFTRTQFTFGVTNQPTGNFTGQFIGVSFQGGGVDGGTAGVWEGNRILNMLPGLYNDTNNSRDQIIRNNYFRAVALGTFKYLTPKSVSTTSVVYGLFSLTNQPPDTPSTNIAKAKTMQPHGFSSGDQVLISGAYTSDGTGKYYDSPAGPGWRVTVLDATNFTYDMSSYGGSTFPSGPAVPPGTGQPPASYATGGGPPNNQQRLLASLSSAPPVNGVVVATGTVSSYFADGHGMSVGETVYISKATPSPSLYNGYFVVTAILDSTRFQFNIASANPIAPSNSGYYGRLWTGGKIVEENNVMDLLPTQTAAYSSTGLALGFFDPAHPVVLFPRVLLRRNIMRPVDGISDPALGLGVATLGVVVQGCGSLIAEENVIDFAAPKQIQYDLCGTAEFFANSTSGAALIQGYNAGSHSSASELSTNIEDAALLAF
jgi:hypothetical protein